MPPRLSVHTLELLTAQANVIALWQLDKPGRRAARRAGALGHWREITDHVYAAAPSEATEEQVIWAAVLAVGPSALLAGQAALFGSGWKHQVARPIDVVVPSTRNPFCPEGVRLHRTTRLIKPAKGGMPRCRPVDACLDAAAWARTDREATFIVITSLSQRLVTPREVQRALTERRSLRRRLLMLETAQEFAGGAMSMGELDFARLCKRYGLRPPDRQVRRKSTRGTRHIDAYWDAERVIVEIDGAGHADAEVLRDDHERQNDLVLQGDRTFMRVFTWVLKYEPEVFMAQLSQVVGKVE